MTPPVHSKAYLMKSLRNNLLRAVKEGQKISDIDIEDHLRDVGGVTRAIDNTEEMQKLQQAINQLPPRQREILHLRFYQDLKNAEISEVMGISYQSVSNLLQRAIRHMKDLVPKDIV